MNKIVLQHWYMGCFDEYGRYFVHKGYVTDSLLEVQYPSKRYPHSILRHIQTKKYAKELAQKFGFKEVQVVVDSSMPEINNYSWEDYQDDLVKLDQIGKRLLAFN